MKKPEILAPVGSWEALQAAIENGADAVYLGGQAFNARQYAQNFDKEGLNLAVRTAHLRGVKVFVTVNTLIANGEMGEMADYLAYLYQLGVDGIIVQDLGVARLVRGLFPRLPLHASTQMTIHNLEGAQFLQGMGFTRVIPARELCLEEIRQLVEGTTLEIEVFIHGALCVCYSGQCFMSSLIWGRSGNRGRCAQPCRMEYSLIREGAAGGRDEIRRGHLLSTRDLRMLECIPELCRCGVAAFKIEGRMKRPQYVATVVRIYREALDRYWADPEHYQVQKGEIQDLTQIFNRGFTTGYLLGQRRTPIVNYKRPNNQGLPIGRVERWGKEGPVVKLTAEVGVGDELRFWVSRGGRVPLTVDRIWAGGKQVKRAGAGERVELPVKGPIRPGDRVFRVKDAALEKRARESYQAPAEYNKIPITMSFKARTGEQCYLAVRDRDGNYGEAQTDMRAEAARKRPLTREKAAAHLLRLGNTPFYAEKLEVNIEGEPMVPFSELNALRRRAIGALEDARLAPYSYPEPKGVESWRQLFPSRRQPKGVLFPRLAVSVNSREKLRAAVEKGADLVYFGGESFRSGEGMVPGDLAWAVEYCHCRGVMLYAAAPRLVRQEGMEAVRAFLREAAAVGADGIQAANLGVLQAAREVAQLPMAIDYSLNIFNNLALELLRKYGVERATLSPELEFAQIEDIALRASLQLECLVAGQLPLMVTEHSLLATPSRESDFYLQDRKEVLFPLLQDRAGRMHIFNARELCLVEDIPRFARIGIPLLRIEGCNRGPDYVAGTTGLYREALVSYGSGTFNPEELVATAEGMYPGGMTKGHYYRGVE